MMKPIETIWFENISVFSEPILSIGPSKSKHEAVTVHTTSIRSSIQHA
jgi:hypothetical protein